MFSRYRLVFSSNNNYYTTIFEFSVSEYVKMAISVQNFDINQSGDMAF